MTKIFMICGAMGAGKTTHARRMAAELGGLRFSIDEWMLRLFMADLPADMSLAWIDERVARCHEQIWALAAEAAARGLPVILDLGFQSRAQRDGMRQRIAAAGFEPVLLHLAAAVETRRARVRQRNAERGETFAFEVTDGMFAAMEPRFEAPQPDEQPQPAV